MLGRDEVATESHWRQVDQGVEEKVQGGVQTRDEGRGKGGEAWLLSPSVSHGGGCLGE